MGAPVDQGGDIVGQLDGGDLGVALADGGVHGVPLVPGLAVLGADLGPGHLPGLLVEFQTGLLPQAEEGGVGVDLLNAHAQAGLVEKHVAGVPDGLGHALPAVSAAVLAEVPAHGLILDPVVVLIPARVQNLLRPGDGPSSSAPAATAILMVEPGA